jgi:hypothetical protein
LERLHARSSQPCLTAVGMTILAPVTFSVFLTPFTSKELLRIASALLALSRASSSSRFAYANRPRSENAQCEISAAGKGL